MPARKTQRAPTPVKYVATSGKVTWRVRFRHNGRPTSETFLTESAAKVFVSDLVSHGADYAVRLRETEAEELHSPTLDQVAEEFWPWKLARVRSDRTVADYKRDYRLHLQPTLGGRKIGSIVERDVQEWVEAQIATAASSKSIRDRHALIHALFEFAAHPARRYVPAGANPTSVTDLPAKPLRALKGLTPAEWQAIYVALRQINGHAADLALFLLASGWRWSEAVALTTHGVEIHGPDRAYVLMSQVMRRTASGKFEIVADAKSQGSLRRTMLDAEASRMIAGRVERAQPGGIVFTTSRGSQWRYPNFRDRFWVPAIQAAQLRRTPTLHELRHSMAGWMLISGASLAEVQRRLGHRSPTTTMGVYGSLVSDVRAEDLDRFAALRGSMPSTLGELPAPS